MILIPIHYAGKEKEKQYSCIDLWKKKIVHITVNINRNHKICKRDSCKYLSTCFIRQL